MDWTVILFGILLLVLLYNIQVHLGNIDKGIDKLRDDLNEDNLNDEE